LTLLLQFIWYDFENGAGNFLQNLKNLQHQI